MNDTKHSASWSSSLGSSRLRTWLPWTWGGPLTPTSKYFYCQTKKKSTRPKYNARICVPSSMRLSSSRYHKRLKACLTDVPTLQPQNADCMCLSRSRTQSWVERFWCFRCMTLTVSPNTTWSGRSKSPWTAWTWASRCSNGKTWRVERRKRCWFFLKFSIL